MAAAVSALRWALASFENDVRIDSLTQSEMEYLADCLRDDLLDDLAAEGLVVVPREPTQAMLDAIVTYPAELVAARNDPAYTAQMQAAALAERALAAQRYRAMIEAARVNKEGR